MEKPSFNISSTQKHLVVDANKTVMDLLASDKFIETAIYKSTIDVSTIVSTIVMEIGISREETPECFLTFFDKHMPGLIDSAISESCELIYFYLG
jgi:hypothetical protein